ncbi:hypothetical protein [Paraburkholderia guartelaensis]|uniref:hypothetical protein n=1 Tax=Paraburkholderia guartelaensis TaxID=2546446 RepID=UPI002AB6BB8F|nr:hypothetical protein [Paraburkholderia guartelaensis]
MSTQKFPAIIKVQIAVAIAAIAVTIGCLIILGPLIQRESKLNGEINSLSSEVGVRNNEINNLNNEIIRLQATRDELKRNISTLVSTARPVPSQQSSVVGWLYVGRVGDTGHWAPLSESVFPSPDRSQTENIVELQVSKNTPLTDNSESNTPLEEKELAPKSTGAVRLVKGGVNLKVVKLWSQPSIGNGRYVWAMVNVAPDQLLEIPGN